MGTGANCKQSLHWFLPLRIRWPSRDATSSVKRAGWSSAGCTLEVWHGMLEALWCHASSTDDCTEGFMLYVLTSELLPLLLRQDRPSNPCSSFTPSLASFTRRSALRSARSASKHRRTAAHTYRSRIVHFRPPSIHGAPFRSSLPQMIPLRAHV